MAVISIEFVRLFLRRDLVGKPVVVRHETDIGCFLRLGFWLKTLQF